MTSADKVLNQVQSDTDFAVVRRYPNRRGVPRPHSVQGEITTYRGPISGTINPGQIEADAQVAAGKDAHSNSHRAHQNAQGIIQYNKNAKSKISEGRYAATVDQIHQNDLHSIERVGYMPQSNDKYAPGNGIIPPLQDTLRNDAKGKSTKSEYIMGVKPQVTYSKDSEIMTSFDPMKDRHTWTMWRTAVNGRIVDEVRRLEKRKKQTANADSENEAVYGTALVTPPLRQFIRIDNDESKAIAAHISSLGSWSLQLPQFVYFGIPRVRMSQPKK